MALHPPLPVHLRIREPFRAISALLSGGGGIRTLGTPNDAQRFSRPPHSTTLPPLREAGAFYSDTLFAPMAISPGNGPDLSDEQREIQALARDFARAEIRPIAAEVDEADVVTPLEVVARAADVGLTSFMLPEEVGGGGIGDVLTGCVVQEELNWGCAGDRQPDHVGGLLRAAPARGRARRRSASAGCGRCAARDPPLTALASTEPGVGSDAAAMTDHGARRTELGLPPARAEDVDLQRRPGRVLRHLRHRRPGHRIARRHRVRGREGRRRRVVRRADAQARPARDRLDRGVPARRRSARRPAAGRGGQGLLQPDAHLRRVARAPGRRRDRDRPRGARVRHRVRPRAHRVRQADRPAPGGRVPARRHGDCASTPPAC